MITEEDIRDLSNRDLYDTITRLSQNLKRLENRIINAMVKADHEKIMKELESEVNLNGNDTK